MIFIKEDLKVNDTQISVLAGILNVWALVGSLAAGRTSDFLGASLHHRPSLHHVLGRFSSYGLRP